ncbi:mCG144473, partial [Mus musculus]
EEHLFVRFGIATSDRFSGSRIAFEVPENTILIMGAQSRWTHLQHSYSPVNIAEDEDYMSLEIRESVIGL